MSQPDRSNSSSRFDWLNPTGEWTQEDYGARPAAASEPYDWTLKDGESRPTQVIPIVSPVKRVPTKLRWLKRKSGVSESSSTIQLKKNTTGKILRERITSLIRPVTTNSLVESGIAIPLSENDKNDKTERLPERAGAQPGRKSPGWGLPLLLLAVLALFVFAYVTQK